MSTIKSCGIILFDTECENVLIVRGKNSHIFSFPKGYHEENETLIECAIRETMEESGVDLNLTPHAFIEKFLAGSDLYYIVQLLMDKNSVLIKPDNNEIDVVKWISLSQLTLCARKFKGEYNYGIRKSVNTLKTMSKRRDNTFIHA